MKKIFIIFLLSLEIGAISQEKKIVGAGNLMWFTNIEDALEDAKERESVILINFTGSDWCHWCFKLDEDVFSTELFNKWQKDDLTLLMIDFPQKIVLSDKQVEHNQLLAQIYGVQGFPTIVFIKSNGEYIGRKGYGKDVKKWIDESKEMILSK